ncbi:MAG: C40 family peptidase [Planctomycetota bacterium]
MGEAVTRLGVVGWPVVFTFDDPAAPASVQTQLRHGAVVEVLERREVDGRAWARVRYGWGLMAWCDESGTADTGWLDARACTETTATEVAVRYAGRDDSSQEPGSGGAWLRTVALAAHGFARPARTAGPSVAVWPSESYLWGAELTDVQAAPGAYGSRWWRVALPSVGGDSPQSGELFVQAGDVMEVGSPVVMDASDALTEVERVIGRPYVWGGASSFGFDCSGLVQMFARRRGVALPHSARRQFTETTSFAGLGVAGEDLAVEQVGGVVRSDGGRGEVCSALGLEHAERARGRWETVLRPGDAVYFAMGGQRVDHVGLWVGGGEMIHASSSAMPGVRREALWGSVYAARMVGARRVGSAAG